MQSLSRSNSNIILDKSSSTISETKILEGIPKELREIIFELLFTEDLKNLALTNKCYKKESELPLALRLLESRYTIGMRSGLIPLAKKWNILSKMTAADKVRNLSLYFNVKSLGTFDKSPIDVQSMLSKCTNLKNLTLDLNVLIRGENWKKMMEAPLNSLEYLEVKEGIMELGEKRRRKLDENFQSLILACPSIKKVTIDRCIDIKQKSLEILFQNCKKITSIDLSTANGIKEEVLSAIPFPDQIVDLKLDLDALFETSAEISAGIFEKIFRDFKNLHTLSLKDNQIIPTDVFIKIIEKAVSFIDENNQLINLELEGNSIKDAIINTLAHKCQRLVSVQLNNCSITEEGITTFLSQLPNLKIFSLIEPFSFKPKPFNLMKLLKVCPPLEFFRFKGEFLNAVDFSSKEEMDFQDYSLKILHLAKSTAKIIGEEKLKIPTQSIEGELLTSFSENFLNLEEINLQSIKSTKADLPRFISASKNLKFVIYQPNPKENEKTKYKTNLILKNEWEIQDYLKLFSTQGKKRKKTSSKELVAFPKKPKVDKQK